MKFYFLLLTALLSLHLSTHAQRAGAPPTIRCATMEADADLRAQHPEMGTLQDFEEWLTPLVKAYKNQPSQRAVVSTLPIIFHVIHNGESVGSGNNISAALINAQITQLNNDFRKLGGTSGDNSNPVGADTEVEFCPARVDPNGNPLAEPGINRINRNSQGWNAFPYSRSYVELTIKPASQWDPNRYINVWVVPLSGGLLGYAQFPSNSGLSGLNTNGGAANTDGVVVVTSSVGSTATPNPNGGVYDSGRTLTHELGHFFAARPSAGSFHPLVLVEERRSFDETQKTLVVTPGPKPPGGKGQVVHIRDHNLQLFEHPLGVVMPLHDGLAVGLLQSGQRPRLALSLVDTPRLLLGFIEIDLKAATSVLLVQMPVCCGF